MAIFDFFRGRTARSQKELLEEASYEAAHNGYSRALPIYRLLAERGNAEAQYKYGYALSEGHGVEKNEAEALVWFERAAAKGYLHAYTWCAMAYRYGTGTEKNAEKAFFWYHKAAEQGNEYAYNDCAHMYYYGIGTEQDRAKAFAWYKKAAEAGFTYSMLRCAEMCEKGDGVEQDIAQAIEWCEKAEQKGDKDASAKLEALRKKAAPVAAPPPAAAPAPTPSPAPAPTPSSAPTAKSAPKAPSMPLDDALALLAETLDDSARTADRDRAVAQLELHARGGSADACFYCGLYHGLQTKDDIRSLAFFKLGDRREDWRCGQIAQWMEDEESGELQTNCIEALITMHDLSILNGEINPEISLEYESVYFLFPEEVKKELPNLLLERLPSSPAPEPPKKVPVKPTFNIALIGAEEAGKTTLFSAIAETLWHHGAAARILPAEPSPRADYLYIPDRVDYDGDTRHYIFSDWEDHESLMRGILTGDPIDGALLVFSPDDPYFDQLRQQLELLAKLGVTSIVALINKADLVDDNDLMEIDECELRELLDTYGFAGDIIPVIYGSAISEELYDDYSTVEELLSTLDAYIPTPEDKADLPFLMPIEDIFSITGRGTVCTGRVERGVIHVNARAELVGIADEDKAVVVTGIEMFKKLLECAEPGDNIGALTSGIARHEACRGQVLCRPGSIKAYTRFEACVWCEAPLCSEMDIYLRTTSIPGKVTVMRQQGGFADIAVELETRVALEIAQAFICRKDKTTIAVGKITDLIG